MNHKFWIINFSPPDDTKSLNLNDPKTIRRSIDDPELIQDDLEVIAWIISELKIHKL